ncbi:MAG: hypothetical protein B7Z73_06115, partial [Planctomycetia bacterium 21-64-5]
EQLAERLLRDGTLPAAELGPALCTGGLWASSLIKSNPKAERKPSVHAFAVRVHASPAMRPGS